MKNLKEFKLSDENLKQLVGGGLNKPEEKTYKTTSIRTTPQNCTGWDIRDIVTDDDNNWVESCYEVYCE